MSVGRMRQKVQLQSKTTANDGGGSAAIDTWTTFATVFASIEPQSGQQQMFGDQLQEPITHKIMIRFRRDLTFKNRILYYYKNENSLNSRYFSIRRVINVDSKDKYLELLCVEGVAT